MIDDAAGFLMAIAFDEIAQQAVSQEFRLADINQPAARVEHSIDAGQFRAMPANEFAEFDSGIGPDVFKWRRFELRS